MHAGVVEVVAVQAPGVVEDLAPFGRRFGGQQGGRWVVLDGLKAGEQVMVDGFQKLMVPGTRVKPVPWTPPAEAAASAPAAESAASAAN